MYSIRSTIIPPCKEHKINNLIFSVLASLPAGRQDKSFPLPPGGGGQGVGSLSSGGGVKNPYLSTETLKVWQEDFVFILKK
jgi:hypothetical protein